MPDTTSIEEFVHHIAENEAIDKAANVLSPFADAILDNEEVAGYLTGAALTGVPLHPALVHLPIGVSIATVTLDVAGAGRLKTAATILNGLTVAAALPTALSGLAEWGKDRADDRERRVGAVHALCAITGTTLSLLALVCRLRGSHGSGRVLSMGSAAAYGAAGLLGGELVYGGHAEDAGDEPQGAGEGS